jgi:hypothetical protein
MACICGLKAFGPTLDFFGKSKMLMKLRTTNKKNKRLKHLSPWPVFSMQNKQDFGF